MVCVAGISDVRVATCNVYVEAHHKVAEAAAHARPRLGKGWQAGDGVDAVGDKAAAHAGDEGVLHMLDGVIHCHCCGWRRRLR